MNDAENPVIDVAKPNVITIAPEYVSITEREIAIKLRDYAIFIKRGRQIQVSIWSYEGDGISMQRFELSGPWDVNKIDDEEIRNVIDFYVNNWDYFIEKQKAEILLSARVKVLPGKVSDKEVLSYELAKIFIEKFSATGVFFETPRGKFLSGVFCYDEGVYKTCEDWLKTQYTQFLEIPQQQRVSKNVIDEVIKNRIPALSNITVSRESIKPVIAFENGLFYFEDFVLSGDFEKSLKPFDKTVFVQHKIPHRLNTELIKRARTGLERYIPPKSCEELLQILKTLSPKSYELLKSWIWFKGVDEKLLESRMCFLLEMIGRALLPGYRLFGDIVFKDIFVLLGPPNSGKTTFLVSFLGNAILGERNYAISKLSSFTTDDDEDARRLFGMLFNVLAVFLPDISKKQKVCDWSLIRSVSGGDPVEARRLRENIFWYYPAYKIYMASNDPPLIKEEGEARRALLNRLKVIEFKNQFQEGGLNLAAYLSEDDIEVVTLCSLYAIRLAYLKKSYSQTGIADVEDVWLRYAEPTYRILMEMIERGLLATSPTLEIYSDDLYNLASNYAVEKAKEELGEDTDDEEVQSKTKEYMPYDQRTFTLKAKEWLKRLKVKTVKRSHKTVFKGIGTPRKELQLVHEVHPG